MTRAERDIIKYGIGGSLAVHLVLCIAAAQWVSHLLLIVPVKRVPPPEPEVTLVFPEVVEAPPPPARKAPEQYIRTTQNAPADAAPKNADFISDRNTVASAKNAPDPDGNVPLPSMKGIDLPTLEMVNREYKDGQVKNDSAIAPPPSKASAPQSASTPPPAPPPPPAKAEPPKPEMRTPEPQKTEIAKKEDAPAEKMLRDELEVRKPEPKEPKPDDPPQPPALPQMRAPQNDPPVPKAIPVATPVPNAPRPEKDSFQPQTRTSNVKGTIASRGSEDSVNAAQTAAGKYYRAVQGAIEQRWHKDVNMKMVYMKPGKIGLRYYVSKNGTVRKEDVSILFDESSPMLRESALRAIFNAKLPPIPEDLLPLLDNERFEVETNFVYLLR